MTPQPEVAPAPSDDAPADTLRRAYRTIRHLQRRLDDAGSAAREPVAVVGVACRLPGGVTDPAGYWRVLGAPGDVLQEVPRARWDVGRYHDPKPGTRGRTTARRGGFLDDVDRFDHEFFGIPHDEAVALDPQQRLTLEVVWEAFEDAGQDPLALAGSRTGVFAAVCTNDFALARLRDVEDLGRHSSIGTAHSAVAGRVGHALDLRGPNVAVDTACSSSLVAVHLAAQSLRAGECDLAVAGGVNVMLSPMTSVAFSHAGMLSPTGRSRPLDAAADGAVNGEGCVFVVLRRLRDAGRDRVRAVVLGSAVNHNGRASSPTAPSGDAQREVVRAALLAADVPAQDVSYVEVHGSSTPIGDALELEALAEVHGPRPDRPLLLGSAKGHIGHLQAAGGVAALLKVVLSLEHGALPGIAGLRAPHPDLPLAGTGLEPLRGLTPWDAPGARRIAGVSTFGFTGTNAHVVVAEAPPRAPVERDDRRPCSVLVVSARTRAALDRLAVRYAELLERGDADLADVCFSAATGRAHLAYRLAVPGASARDVAERLRRFAAGAPDAATLTGQVVGAPAEVGLLVPGDAWPAGAAAALLDSSAVFAAAVAQCDAAMPPGAEGSLVDTLRRDLAPGRPDVGPAAHPAAHPAARLATGYALARLWESWGVRPAAVLGTGVGELTAACLSGALDLADALRLAVVRGRAATGRPAGVPATEAALAAAGGAVPSAPPSLPFVSTLTGETWPWTSAPPAAHWARQGVERARLRDALGALGPLGVDVVLVAGAAPHDDGTAPHPLAHALVPSIVARDDVRSTLVTALAALAVAGAAIDWEGVDRDHRRVRVDVPTYPFERTRC